MAKLLNHAGTLLLAIATIAPAAWAGPDTARRPADADRWVFLGSTLHMKAEQPAEPQQLRVVHVDPAAYDHLVKTGAFPDGTRFAVAFYSLKTDASDGGAPLYAGDKETFFALEVLDTKHPDGRRFYAFTPTQTTATALPAGNSCAACHNAHGSVQGTFAHDYPLVMRLIQQRPGSR